MIKDIKSNNEIFEGEFLVQNSQTQVGTNGVTFVALTLQDASGTIEAKKWDATKKDIEILKQGNFIKARAKSNLFREKLQLILEEVKQISCDEIDVSNFVNKAPVDIEELVKSLNKYIESIKNEDANKIVKKLINDNYEVFINHPAAVRNHHEYLHGLLFHSLTMCKNAESICNIYKEVDYDLLISGCLLHDIGKIVELSKIIGCHYTKEGYLLGHLVIGAMMIENVSKELNIKSDVPLLLEHMILSHHGKPEFGAAVLPQTREALLLNMIDDMDAKMATLKKVLDNVNIGEFSERIFPLENRSFYKDK